MVSEKSDSRYFYRYRNSQINFGNTRSSFWKLHTPLPLTSKKVFPRNLRVRGVTPPISVLGIQERTKLLQLPQCILVYIYILVWHAMVYIGQSMPKFECPTYFDIWSIWRSNWIFIFQNVFLWNIQIIKCKSPGNSPETLIRIILFRFKIFRFSCTFFKIIIKNFQIFQNLWKFLEPFLMEAIPHVRIRWDEILFCERVSLDFFKMLLIRSKNDANPPKILYSESYHSENWDDYSKKWLENDESFSLKRRFEDWKTNS